MALTVEKIKLLLPDQVLVALTDDTDSGTINENLIQEIIDDGYNFISGIAPNVKNELKDEAVKNYVLSFLYAYAGLEEKAERYQDLYLKLLASFGIKEEEVVFPNLGAEIKSSSNSRVFTDEELEKW